MATFSGKTAGLGKLQYDFREWLGDDGPVGTIPEPSDKKIEHFFDTLKDLTNGADEDMSREELIELSEEMDFAEMQEKMSEAVGELCSDSPDSATLARLPFRVRQVFFKWVMNQVQDPESEASATKPARGRRNGG